MAPPAHELNQELVAHQLKSLENSMNELKRTWSNSLKDLVTREYFDIRLRNIEEAHKTMVLENKEKEKTDAQRDFQVKLAVLVAFISPLVSFGLAFLLKG